MTDGCLTSSYRKYVDTIADASKPEVRKVKACPNIKSSDISGKKKQFVLNRPNKLLEIYTHTHIYIYISSIHNRNLYDYTTS